MEPTGGSMESRGRCCDLCHYGIGTWDHAARHRLCGLVLLPHTQKCQVHLLSRNIFYNVPTKNGRFDHSPNLSPLHNNG